MTIQEAYGALLYEALPSVIETGAQYDSLSERLSGLIRKGRNRTPEETRLMKLLAVLVRDYDERQAFPPASMSPEEAIRFLMEHSGKTPSDLLGIFGQRSHVSEALSGKREISLEQARKLAKIFSVSPRLFI
jgi:HTH-type transcriptional regulator/antitoxin HigA